MSSFYSCNDNQNYFVENGKTTSRVTQVPGGQSTLSLAWGNKEVLHQNQDAEKQGRRVSSFLVRKSKCNLCTLV